MPGYKIYRIPGIKCYQVHLPLDPLPGVTKYPLVPDMRGRVPPGTRYEVLQGTSKYPVRKVTGYPVMVPGTGGTGGYPGKSSVFRQI